MEKILNMEEFAERVCQSVKGHLPYELDEAEVYVTCVDTGEDRVRVLLVVFRPWHDISTGFYLENWYKDYSAGMATVESVTAAIINDDRLYHVFFDTDFLHDNVKADNNMEMDENGKPV